MPLCLVSGCCRWPPGWLARAAQGVAEVWYLTKAMAASSLQNSSSTITPSSNVMWSMLGREEIAGNQDRPTQTQPRVSENVQCVYSHGPLWLQAQQAFSDQQKFGGEIWDALDSNHEVSDDLQSPGHQHTKLTPLHSAWQQGSMAASVPSPSTGSQNNLQRGCSAQKEGE